MLWCRKLGRRLGLFLAACVANSAVAIESLPEGHSGIAARYPGDYGIASDASVIFSDDFETYASSSDLAKRWNQVFHVANLRIATEEDNRYAGAKALEMTVPAGPTEVANELRKVLSPARDVVFIRAQTLWHSQNDVVGSSHNGLRASANYCCAGVPANGSNKFAVASDVFRLDKSVRNPGETSVYIYHPEQRSEWGDYWYSDGKIIPFDSIPGDFGPGFVPRPRFVPQLGKWYSWEMMVKANTPGQRDGRVAIWVDGALVADWPNVRLRDVSGLKIDVVSLDMHANASRMVALRKYYDNVVVAASYIGPVFDGDGGKPRPPTDVRVSAVSIRQDN